MIAVIIPFTNEEAFDEGGRVRPDVYQWLNEHMSVFNWRTADFYEDHPLGGGRIQTGIIFEITDPDLALLFKLTWGGDQ